MSLLQSPDKIELLKVLKKLKPDQLSTLIKFLNTDSIDCIGECCYNLLYTNLGLKKKTKKRIQNTLRGKEKIIKILSNRTNSIDRRKKILKQNGGFIGVLAATVLPIIADLIYNAVKK